MATRQYEVANSATAKTFTYDANGNLTSDGTRTLEWDARNQLVAVAVGTHRSEFTYDGLQRRVRLVEKENGVTQSDTKVLWCETAICEERGPDGVAPTRRAFGLGEQIAGVARFFAADHTGSVTDIGDASAASLARYAFDPWGRRTLSAGSDITTVGYTGHRWQASGGVSLTVYRAYDAELGRWVSEDPIGPGVSDQRYAYVVGNPIRFVDPDGRAGAPASGAPKSSGGWKTDCGNAPPLPPNGSGACKDGGAQVNLYCVSWDLDCVCKNAGDDPGANCVRACIQCAKNRGANVTTLEPHSWCKESCRARGVWTYDNDQKLNDTIWKKCQRCWFQ